MHSMTYFILLLATVGVINNLLINYMQKRRDIAMYRSVGLSNRQNIKMTLIEVFFSGLIGAVIAIFVSYMEIQTIFLVAGAKISMMPELSAKTFLMGGAMGILVTLLGNLMMFMPIGVFLPAIFKKQRKWFCFLITTILILMGVEIIQLVFRLGVLDIDDFILNAAGACLAYAIIRIGIVKRFLNKTMLI